MQGKQPKAKYLGSRYITDGDVRGVVRMTSKTHVSVVDLLTGRHHQIEASKARRMTKAEIDKYNDTPSARDPKPSEIAERSQKIRASWSGDERVKRVRTINDFISIFER